VTNYLVRMMNRDLAKSKFRIFGSSALIMMAVAAYISLAVMVPSAQNALEARVQSLNLCDYIVHLGQGNQSLANDVKDIPGVETVDYRVTVSSRIRFTNPSGQLEDISAMLIGIEPSRLPYVNTIETVKGSYFQGNASGNALIENSFGKREGIGPGSSISILTGSSYSAVDIVAMVSSPEFMLLPLNPQSVLPLPGTLAVVYLPIDSLRSMMDLGHDYVNEILMLFDHGSDQTALISSVDNLLASHGIVYALNQDQVYGYSLVREDLAQGGNFSGLMAFMVLFAAFFVIYTHFSRTVDEQKKHIGVTRALGYTSRSIFGSYIYMAAVMGIVGAIAGLVAGYPIAKGFSDYYVSQVIGGSSSHLVFSLDTMLIAFAFGPVTACLACAVAVWGTVSMEPNDAMREMGTQKRPRKVRNRRRSPSNQRISFMTLYTLRTMFRRRKRTTFTVIAVAFAIVIGGMAFPLIGSFQNSITSNTQSNEHWDLVVDYSYPLNRTQAERITAPTISETVQIAKATGAWEINGETGTATVVSLDDGQDLHEYNLLKGTVFTNADEAMIGYALGKKLGVGVGDIITLKLVTGPAEFPVTAVVADLVGDIFVYQAVMKNITGQLVLSGSYVKCVPGGQSEASQALLASPLVADVQLRVELQSGITDLMQSYSTLLYAFSMIGVGIATVTIANMVFMGILERYKEYGQLRAIGYPKKSVSRSMSIEVLVTVIIAALGSIPLLFLLLQSFVGTFREFWPVYRTMVHPADMIGYVFVVALTMLFGLIATIPAVRHLNKMDLAKTVSGSRFG
jgi:putative ABC transport system permease protein